MKQSALDGIFSGNRIAGVEVVLSQPSGISLTVLKKERSAVVTEFNKSSINSIDELTTKLPAGVGVQLSVSGKGIIHKKLAVLADDNDKNYLQAVLPNANINDFYLQKVIADGGQIFVSVIRKQVLDELLLQLKEKGIQVIDCFLGPFSVNSIAPLLDRNEIAFQNHRLAFSANTISEYQLLENTSIETIDIGNESIKPELLISFATAFSYFLAAKNRSSNIQSVDLQKEEYRQQKRFQKLIWLIAAAFFVLLMTNFVLFNSFFDKKNELSTQLSFNQEKLTRYEALKKEYDDKKTVIEKLGLNKSSRTSYYTDQLAVDMPNSIMLSKLSVYPAQKKSNTDETIFEFNTSLLQVEGSCSKSVEVNEWIKIIKQKQWIQDVALLNYVQGKESDRGEFALEIRLK